MNTIVSGVDVAQVGSLLDIGCNEGLITNHFSELGKFAVGIDVCAILRPQHSAPLHARNGRAFGTVS